MKKYIVALLALFTVGVLAFSGPQANAINLFDRCTSTDANQCKVVKENNLNYQGKNAVWTIMQFVLGILGGIAVIMIIVGGLRFTLSNGDASSVASAKKTILYAVIGLIVAIMAGGIVTLVNNYFG